MPARSPRCGQKSRAVKPGLHPRLPSFGGSVGRSSAEDGWGWLFALGVPLLPAQEGKKCARLRAPCVRQNWGDRANSHPPAVADPVGPAKPHQTEGMPWHQVRQAALRGPGKRERGCDGNMPQRPFPSAKTSAAVPCITETPGSLARKLAEMEARRIDHLCDCRHPEDREKFCLRP